MLQDLDHALAEGGCETLEDEVRVGLRDGAAGGVGNVVTEDDVVQTERCGRAVGHVGDGECCGSTTVLVEKDEIAEAGRLGGRDQVGQNQVTSVQADTGGQQQTDLFGERGETAARVARSGHEDTRVNDTGQVGVFVVKVQLILSSAVGAGLVVLVVLAQFLVVGNCRVERFASGQRLLQLCALLADFGIFEGEGAAVKVVAPLAGLSSDHFGVGVCE